MVKTYSDPCSFSNPEFYVISHINFNWKIDFVTKIIKAICTYTFKLNSNSDNKIIVMRVLLILIYKISGLIFYLYLRSLTQKN